MHQSACCSESTVQEVDSFYQEYKINIHVIIILCVCALTEPRRDAVQILPVCIRTCETCYT